MLPKKATVNERKRSHSDDVIDHYETESPEKISKQDNDISLNGTSINTENSSINYIVKSNLSNASLNTYFSPIPSTSNDTVVMLQNEQNFQKTITGNTSKEINSNIIVYETDIEPVNIHKDIEVKSIESNKPTIIDHIDLNSFDDLIAQNEKIIDICSNIKKIKKCKTQLAIKSHKTISRHLPETLSLCASHYVSTSFNHAVPTIGQKEEENQQQQSEVHQKLLTAENEEIREGKGVQGSFMLCQELLRRREDPLTQHVDKPLIKNAKEGNTCGISDQSTRNQETFRVSNQTYGSKQLSAVSQLAISHPETSMNYQDPTIAHESLPQKTNANELIDESSYPSTKCAQSISPSINLQSYNGSSSAKFPINNLHSTIAVINNYLISFLQSELLQGNQVHISENPQFSDLINQSSDLPNKIINIGSIFKVEIHQNVRDPISSKDEGVIKNTENFVTCRNCPICMDYLKEKVVVSTLCGHIFCMPCIQAALRSTSKKCPTCRK